MGRPSIFTAEIAAAICERMEAGESLRAICRDDAMPSRSAVLQWLRDNEDFRRQYALADRMRADHYADEILEIADDASGDLMPGQDGDAGLSVNHENIQRARLRVDARKWIMSKLAPKKYGDKLALAGDDESPLTVMRIERIIVDPPHRGE